MYLALVTDVKGYLNLATYSMLDFKYKHNSSTNGSKLML